ncbi:MAG: DUF58 domain-containing protein [Chloroflexota bacterium]
MRISSTPLPSRSSLSPHDKATVFSAGFPVFFHWLAMVAFAGIALFAALQQVASLLALVLFILALGVVSWLWSLWSLRRLELEVRLSQSRAFPDETVEVSLALTNRKWLPLPWLSLELDLPYRLVRGRRTPSRFVRERWRWATAVSGGQSLRWRQSLKCLARGEYRLGPGCLRTGDLFGLYPVERIEPVNLDLLVYPMVMPVDLEKLKLTGLVGERAVPRTLYEDSSRTMGARDYQLGDPFKRVHWKASARRGELQARVYESTTSLSTMLVLDAAGFGGGGEDDFELAVTAVASLAAAVSGAGSPVGLALFSGQEVVLPASAGRDRLLDILEALARVEPSATPPTRGAIERLASSLMPGALTLVVTGAVSPGLAGLVIELRHQDQFPMVLLVSAVSVPGDVVGVPVLPVRSMADLSGGSKGRWG